MILIYNLNLVQCYYVVPPTGMGDTCVWGTAWAPHPANRDNGRSLNSTSRSTPRTALLMAVADGGVARTMDDGETFQRVSEGWAGTEGLNSQGTAIVTDTHTGCVYAGHSDRGAKTSPNSVFKFCDGGDSWRLIGGYGGSTAIQPTGRGLSISGRITHLAIDHSSPPHSRRLLLGAGLLGGHGQIWMYEPSAEVMCCATRSDCMLFGWVFLMGYVSCSWC